MANANIGHLTCPMSGDLCVVRQDCRGKFYFYSNMGKITPNLFGGQEWVKKHLTKWDAPEQPPDGLNMRLIAAGLPPILERCANKNSLTPKDEPERPEKQPAIVNKPAPKPPEKQSVLSAFMWGDKNND